MVLHDVAAIAQDSKFIKMAQEIMKNLLQLDFLNYFIVHILNVQKNIGNREKIAWLAVSTDFGWVFNLRRNKLCR